MGEGEEARGSEMLKESLPSGEEMVEQLREKVAYLETLLRTSQVINSSLNLSEVLDLVLGQARMVMEAEAGTIWLIEEEEQDIMPYVAHGPRVAQFKKLRLKLGEGIAGRVAQSGQPLLVSDVQREPQWASRFDQSSGFVTRSILCVPLKIEERCIGSMQLINKKDGLFQERDVELCSALANQAAVVIENSRLYTELQELFLSTITTLATALDTRDAYTHGHSLRVRDYCLMIADELGMSASEKETVDRAAVLHDIGKIGIRDDVLLNPNPLNEEQLAIIRTHPVLGDGIISQIQPKKLLKDARLGARYHQERYEGGGYPDGLKGEEIPWTAQMIAVADTFDAMTTDRPYRKGMSFEVAKKRLKEIAGTQLSPVMVDAFVRALDKREAKGEKSTG